MNDAEFNPYASNATVNVAESDAFVSTKGLFVVGKTKFLLLSILSFNLYWLVCMYKHWDAMKRKHGLSIWPVARSIFSVFFTHSLLDKVAQEFTYPSEYNKLNARSKASALVFLLIASNLFTRLTSKQLSTLTLEVIGIVLGLVVSWAAWKVQEVINIAADDPNGKANTAYSPTNYVVMVIGGIFWILVLFGLTQPLP